MKPIPSRSLVGSFYHLYGLLQWKIFMPIAYIDYTSEVDED
jgi:hypothetical protein